jgi:hypothetical protein
VRPTVRLGDGVQTQLLVISADRLVSVAGPKETIFVAGADVMSSTSAKYCAFGGTLGTVRVSPVKTCADTVCETVSVT